MPVVEIDGLTKRFGAVTAVDGLSFVVEQGQVHGLLGPNGAGKTTALRALLGRPELLVLDEPTNGLDPGEIKALRLLIQGAAARGVTIVFSSHHLSEVEQTCTHATVMSLGRKVFDGTLDGLLDTGGPAGS